VDGRVIRMSDTNRREGLSRLRTEITFLDDVGPARVRDYHDIATIEELEPKVAPDDQSSAGFLD
jgi:hypothetical protein